MKNKWLAGFLNIVPGLGYLYAGTRTPFALLLLAFWPVLIISLFLVAPLPADSYYAEVPMGFWDFAPFLVVPIAFMTDAFNEVAESKTKDSTKS
ncbi:MAG: hypothetical protein ABWX94_01025 [Candidatus Saccharimonadales bacterium]